MTKLLQATASYGRRSVPIGPSVPVNTPAISSRNVGEQQGNLAVKPEGEKASVQDSGLERLSNPRITSGIESLRDALKREAPEQKFILGNFVPDGGNVAIGVGQDVDPTMWYCLLMHCVTSGRGMEPFGNARAATVVSVAKPHTQNQFIGNMALILKNETNSEHRDLVEQNALFLWNNLGGYAPGYLHDIENLRAIENSMPAGCKVVMYYGAEIGLTPSKSKTPNERHFSDHVGRLNANGIATVIFSRVGRGGAEALEDQLPTDSVNHFVNLVADPEAPSDFGGGFKVIRKRASEFDTAPTCFQVWHTNIGGQLESGWEIRDQTKPKSKNVEMIERRMRLKQLLDSGMQQKEAASILKVHEATVSRDAAEIKRREGRRKTNDQDGVSDYESNGGRHD